MHLDLRRHVARCATLALVAGAVLASCRELGTDPAIGAHSASLVDGDPPAAPIAVETVLTPSDAAEAARFGAVVAISGDFLVSTAPSWNVDGDWSVGAAYVFRRDVATGQWTEQKKLIPHDSADEWQVTVAIDGDTVAVGTPNVSVGNGFQQGAVYLFGRDQGGADNWGEIIKLSGARTGDLGHFGASVALAGDLLVVGATQPPSIGVVAVFERDRGGPGAWGRVTEFSYNDDAGLSPEFFGVSLAIDGDLLLVGATSADVSYYASNDGAAYLFRRDAVDRDRWAYVARFTQPEATLCTGGRTISEMWTEPQEVQDAWQLCAQGDTATDNAGFGGNVALHGDTAAVIGQGAVHVFRDDGAGHWPQVQKLENADGFGYGRVALEGDTLLVGSSGTTIDSNPHQGMVHVFERDPATQAFIEVAQMIASDGMSEDYFASGLALEGSTTVIGALDRNAGRGGVYVHEADPPPPPPPACQPAFPTTDTLENGKTIETPAGFWLAALPGALPAPAAVWATEAGPAVEPVFAPAVPLGGYFHVGAACTTSAPPLLPFVVGFPVPDGVDTSQLAVAVLWPASSVAAAPAGSRGWTPISGSFDPARRLYLVALTTLAAEGTMFRLIQDPQRAPSAARAARVPAGTTPTFEVHCSGRVVGTPACGAAQEAAFAAELLAAYRVYNGEHFPDPHLNSFQISVAPDGSDPDPAITVDHTYDFKDALIVSPLDGDCARDQPAGYYSPSTLEIVMCLDPARAFTAGDVRIIARHELFHAVQFANPKVRDLNDSWVLEGTATAAEQSAAVMRRAQLPLRIVYESLTAGRYAAGAPNTLSLYPYQAQDFWVYLFQAIYPGAQRNYPLGDLQQLLRRGASTSTVAAALASAPNSKFEDLGKEYWRWVKNQVMEKAVVFGPMSAPCRLEGSLIGPDRRPPVELEFPQSTEVVDHIESTLQSEVVQIRIHSDVPTSDVTIRAVRTGGTGLLAYKVYLRGEATCGDGIPDGPRTFATLPPNPVLHVLVANKGYRESNTALDYKVSVELPEGSP